MDGVVRTGTQGAERGCGILILGLLGAMMAVSILHVGLPLEHASIPEEDRAAVRERLRALQEEMRAAGYGYEIVCVDPEGGIGAFKERLRAGRVDGVLVGGGVVGNPAMSWFLEELVEAVRTVVPEAKVMLHSHAEAVRVTVERWFPDRAATED